MAGTKSTEGLPVNEEVAKYLEEIDQYQSQQMTAVESLMREYRNLQDMDTSKMDPEVKATYNLFLFGATKIINRTLANFITLPDNKPRCSRKRKLRKRRL